MMDQASILIIDENHVRAAIIQEGLREAGHVHVRWLNETANLLKRIVDIDPDVIIIDLESPNRDVLEQMFQVSRLVRRPIAMFVDQSDSISIRDAMLAGVSAYVVDGLKKERVKHILDMCVQRFEIFSRMEEELHEAKTTGRSQGDRARQGHIDDGQIAQRTGCLCHDAQSRDGPEAASGRNRPRHCDGGGDVEMRRAG